MAPTKEQCLQQIQSTVDLLFQFESWENAAFVKALGLGIQGKKREARLEGTKDLNIRKYLQSATFDIFETEIYPKAVTTHFPTVNSIDGFLTEYRRGLWDIYWKLHEVANTFVSPLCMRDIACPLYERATCIKNAIVDLNRKIRRWEDVKKYGTPLHDLYIYETSEYNNHDEAEKNERKFGYDY